MKNDTITGLEEKFEVLLVYLVSLLGFVFSFIKDKKVSKNIRFHYNQSATLFIITTIFDIAMKIINPFFGFIFNYISWVLYLLIFIASLVTVLKAFNDETYEIPLISDLTKLIWK